MSAIDHWLTCGIEASSNSPISQFVADPTIPVGPTEWAGEVILNASMFMLLNRIVSAHVGHLLMSDCVGILAGTWQSLKTGYI